MVNCVYVKFVTKVQTVLAMFKLLGLGLIIVCGAIQLSKGRKCKCSYIQFRIVPLNHIRISLFIISSVLPKTEREKIRKSYSYHACCNLFYGDTNIEIPPRSSTVFLQRGKLLCYPVCLPGKENLSIMRSTRQGKPWYLGD